MLLIAAIIIILEIITLFLRQQKSPTPKKTESQNQDILENILGKPAIEIINNQNRPSPTASPLPTQSPKTLPSKCCFSSTGQEIPMPKEENCQVFEIERSSKLDLDSLAQTIENETGLILVKRGDGGELNGYLVARTIGNVYKYEIHFYQSDAINYEYNPPYTYKSTKCTPEVKEKLSQIAAELK